MRAFSLRSAVMATALFLSTSAFAPAPTAASPLLRQSMLVQDCNAMMQCFAQCPTQDVNEWEACKQVCSDLFPCTLGE